MIVARSLKKLVSTEDALRVAMNTDIFLQCPLSCRFSSKVGKGVPYQTLEGSPLNDETIPEYADVVIIGKLAVHLS